MRAILAICSPLLTVTVVYSSPTKKDILLRDNIEEIKKVGERSALLTYQSLAFSRQQVFKREVIDSNKVIREISNMLQRLISEDVQLVARLASKLNHIKADSGQLSHLIFWFLPHFKFCFARIK